MAWRTFHDVNPADAPLYVLWEPIDLFNNREDLDILLSRIASLPAGAPTVEFICLDTTSRVLAGADENSSRDFGASTAGAPISVSPSTNGCCVPSNPKFGRGEFPLHLHRTMDERAPYNHAQ